MVKKVIFTPTIKLPYIMQYGCTKTLPPLYNTEVTSHGTFLVDVDKVVRLSMHYSPSIGRNIYEILRAFDALQLATHHKVICPSNWSQGQELFVHNAVPSDQAGALFPKGFVEIKPWFRVTPVPESTSSTA